jgi:small subunit ribosomal protein S6
MNQYELMIIFDPVLSEDDLKDEIGTYKDIVTASGGSIVHEERWGLRPLAYTIRRKTTGIYYLCEFKCEGEIIAKLETQFGRDDRIIRQVITRLDKYGVAYAERRRQKQNAPKEEPRRPEEPAVAEAVDTNDTQPS